MFSLFSSFLNRFTTAADVGTSSLLLVAEGPVQMTEGLELESVLLLGLEWVLDTEYSDDPVLMVGDGLVVSVMKVGEVEVKEVLGEVGLEAMAAS